jgi:hypothetical protein
MKLAVTLEDIVKSSHSSIYYSANTIWWTDDPTDLCEASEEHLELMAKMFGQAAVESFKENPVPLDPFNSPLYQTENMKAFLNPNAITSHDAYGPKVETRLETFMWSHAKNMALILDKIKEHLTNEPKSKAVMRFQDFHNFLLSEGILNTGVEQHGQI